MKSIEQWLAYPPRLAMELGSCVDDEAYGWAWKPYGWFGPAPRPSGITLALSYLYDAATLAAREHLAAPATIYSPCPLVLRCPSTYE